MNQARQMFVGERERKEEVIKKVEKVRLKVKTKKKERQKEGKNYRKKRIES